MSYDYNKKLRPNNVRPVRQLEYSKIIDSLMYAMSCTRPDIAFSVGTLRRFTINTGKPHQDFIMRYLKGTLNLGLL